MSEALVELNELLMYHGMVRELSDEVLFLTCCRQLSMQESITTVCKITLLC